MHDVRALFPSMAPRTLSTGARWHADDGKTPALAFYGLDQPDDQTPMQNAIVWTAPCSCIDWLKCPAKKALDKACDIYGAASVVIVKPVRVAK